MKKVLDDKTQITNKKKLKKIEDEIWKELPGSNGLYFVSNYGRIKLYKIYKKDGEIIKGTNLKGYRVISLYIKGKSSRVLLHKLVAETWITKPSKDCKYVIHLDWNKKNNQVKNLAWVSYQEMLKRMAKNYSERPKNPYRKIIITNSKLKDADVAFMKTLINRGVAQTKIAKLFCISVTQVRRIARGENWGHVQPKQ